MDALQTFATGDTDYVGKLNANSAATVDAVTAVETSKLNATQVGIAGGVAPLDGDAKLPMDYLPGDIQYKVERGVANGYAELDENGRIPAAEMPIAGSLGLAVMLPMYYQGRPVANAILWKIVCAIDLTLPATLTGSKGDVGTTPTGAVTLAVKVNGATVGGIDIGTDGTFTFSADQDIVLHPGDVLSIRNQVGGDLTCADVSVTLYGYR